MPSLTRFAFAVACAAALALPAVARAQDNSPATTAYREKREQLLRELEEAQKQLADIRQQRVQLSARIENVIAQMAQQRAQALLMSNEQNALQQLDAILTSSQDNLLMQRDRFLALGEAVRRRSGAVLVVLFRADSAGGQQMLGSGTLTVDGTSAAQRSYTVSSSNALSLGAVDQLYRASVLPTSHTVQFQVAVGGQALTQSVTVNASADQVTYVQFSLRGGQLVPTTWTSTGTTPF